MKTHKSLLLTGLLSVSLLGSAAATPDKPFVREGIWRGVFTLNESQVPFNFELKGKDPEHAVFTLINGTRRDDFHVQRIGADSLFIKMNTYDAALVAKIEDDGKITGEYRSLVPNFRGNALPFSAEYGQSYRFAPPGTEAAPQHDISGKWDLTIYSKEPTPNRVGLLKQQGNKLTGVIMSVVGDSRELEGTVHGDEFELSGFTGPSPIYIKGKINDDKSLTGELSLGIYNNIKFDGSKNAEAALPDPYKLTFLKEGYKKLDFTLPDLDGKNISLSDEKYKGKVVIVEIIGTWCPNCTDQTSFLSPWYNKNKDRGVEAIAIGFEQKDDLEYARYTLGKLKEKYNIQYDILFGGIADKKVASEKLPALNRMMAFPTTILIDRKGEVRQIHTGYTGEITGKYYQDYVAKWNKDLEELIAEK